jgi:PKD repeat protein
MSITSLWRVILIACFSLFITACKPVADFFYEPAPTTVGQVTSFNASGTIITDEAAEEELEAQKHKEKDKDKKTKPPKPSKKQVIYNWNFGDGSSGSGITATHIYSTAGTYTATLTVKDRDGKVGTISKQVIVKPLTGALSQLNILVLGTGGVLLSEAQVSIAGTANTTATGMEGTATLSAISGTQTVIASKSGYITQAVQTVLLSGKASTLLLTMQSVKEIKAISSIETAQNITATLGSLIALPANALVNPDGSTATGTVTLQLTPWDITKTDLSAMLGNGKALDSNGQMIELISAGMITVDFYNAAGQHLQLGAGKTANIQMDLPYANINGIPLQEGSTIPLWSFKEDIGLWKQEGTGTVVVSASSPVGLAVKATVNHFSTWNWDFKFENAGSVTVHCVEGTTTVPCAIQVDVQLPGGSRFTKTSYSVIDTVTRVVNMPTTATITWTGTTIDGRQGTVVSGASGDVVIGLALPKTKNFVQCSLSDATAVSCETVLNIVATDGSLFSQTYHIPPEGAFVRTVVRTSNTLAWSAQSALRLNGAGQLAHYEGTTASYTTGTVSLVLATEVLFNPATSTDRVLLAKCDPVVDVITQTYDPITFTYINTITGTETLQNCTINLRLYDNGETTLFNFQSSPLAPGEVAVITIPASVDLSAYGFGDFNVSGTTTNGSYAYNSAYQLIDFTNLPPVSPLTTYKLVTYIYPPP